MTSKEQVYIEFAKYLSNSLSCGINQRLSNAIEDVKYNVRFITNRAINVATGKRAPDRDDLLGLEESLEVLVDLASELKRRVERERIEIFEGE